VRDTYNIGRIRSPNSDGLAGLRIVVTSLFNVSPSTTEAETNDDEINNEKDRHTMSMGLGPLPSISESHLSWSGGG
jgi:hypothetical protein